MKLAEQLSNIPPESDGHFHFFSKEIIDKNVQARCVDEEEARRAGKELMEVDTDSGDQGTPQSPMLVDGELTSLEPSGGDPMSSQSVESLPNSLTVSAVTTAPQSPFADLSLYMATAAEAQSLHASSNDSSSNAEPAQFPHALSANSPALTDPSISSANQSPLMSINLPAQTTTHSQPDMLADPYLLAAIDATAQSSTASTTSYQAIDSTISYLHALYTSSSPPLPVDSISQVMSTMFSNSSPLPADIEIALTNLSPSTASVAEAQSPHAPSTDSSFNVATAQSPHTTSANSPPLIVVNEMAESSHPLSTNFFASSINPYPLEAINTTAQSSTALTDSYPATDSTVSYLHTNSSLPMPVDSISQFTSTMFDNSSTPGNIQTAQSYLH